MVTTATHQADPLVGKIGIPIIDISGFLAGDEPATEKAVTELRYALENVGFFIIAGHGIDWSLVDTAYAQAKRFFDLPDAAKEKIAIAGSFSEKYGQRGYMGFTGDAYGSRRAMNRLESFYLGHEKEKNRWPEGMDDFQGAMLDYIDAVRGLAYGMLPLYARALELDADFFSEYFQNPAVSFRAAHYAPAGDDPKAWGIIPHTDRAFMTLLPANNVAGLQIRPDGSEWLDAPFVPNAFIVNSGDTLRRWTNDRFLSTPHRVAPPTQDRYSLPYFYSPSTDKVMAPIETCVSDERPARYEAILLDDFNKEYYSPTFDPKDPRLKG